MFTIFIFLLYLKNNLFQNFQIPKCPEMLRNFETKWNFPHCIGTIDGKHIAITKPPVSGSYYFNYKKACSIVLLALVNAIYEFIMVECGPNGRVSDGGVFTNSDFNEKLQKGSLNIPEYSTLSNSSEDTKLVFVGDDAFSLSKHLVKPFKRQRNNFQL